MRPALDRFEAGFARLTAALAVLGAASIGLIAVLIPLNLLLIRTGLGNIWWLFEGVEYTLYFGVFLGAPWVLRQGAHVRVDVVTSALPAPAAARLERVMDGAGFALCALLCVYGVRAALTEYEDATLPDKDLRIDNWIVLAAFAASFLMLAIEFLLRMRETRAQPAGHRPRAGDSGL